jgi:LmbE family N-acetylglucosaminyl deacetylase
MLSIDFTKETSVGTGLRIQCLGAHCDDIEIGCGGRLLKLIRQDKVAEIHWVVFCSTPERKKEAEKSAALFLEHTEHTVTFHNYKDGYTPVQWSDIKDRFEELKSDINPDLIFTHTRGDRHQDHLTIHNLTWNTFRNHLILEYEIPKYDGDLGQPNFFVALDKKVVNRKIGFIKSAFKSQVEKQWFDDELFKGLMRIRGVESVSKTGFSEAFYARKLHIN